MPKTSEYGHLDKGKWEIMTKIMIPRYKRRFEGEKWSYFIETEIKICGSRGRIISWLNTHVQEKRSIDRGLKRLLDFNETILDHSLKPWIHKDKGDVYKTINKVLTKPESGPLAVHAIILSHCTTQ